MKQSDQVREIAKSRFVEPALLAGKTRFSVAVKDVLKDLVAEGFPPGNTPQVCSALRKETFLREHGLEIESIDGPPSKMSTTVVFHYKVATPRSQSNAEKSRAPQDPSEASETPEARTRRLGESLRGILRDELAEYGGAEGFIRWVRGYDEEDAA